MSAITWQSLQKESGGGDIGGGVKEHQRLPMAKRPSASPRMGVLWSSTVSAAAPASTPKSRKGARSGVLSHRQPAFRVRRPASRQARCRRMNRWHPIRRMALFDYALKAAVPDVDDPLGESRREIFDRRRRQRAAHSSADQPARRATVAKFSRYLRSEWIKQHKQSTLSLSARHASLRLALRLRGAGVLGGGGGGGGGGGWGGGGGRAGSVRRRASTMRSPGVGRRASSIHRCISGAVRRGWTNALTIAADWPLAHPSSTVLCRDNLFSRSQSKSSACESCHRRQSSRQLDRGISRLCAGIPKRQEGKPKKRKKNKKKTNRKKTFAKAGHCPWGDIDI